MTTAGNEFTFDASVDDQKHGDTAIYCAALSFIREGGRNNESTGSSGIFY